MNEKTKRTVATVLGFCLTCGMMTGCKKEEKIPQLPDYSTMSKEYDFFAYQSPGNGTLTMDGVTKTVGEDLRTVENYTVYKEAGFTMLMQGPATKYLGDDWETSECKKAWENALEAGIDKMIVQDNRFESLVSYKDNLIGTGTQYRFTSEDELNEYVKECLSTYKDMEGFYGVKLWDEPDYTYTNAIDKIYKAIKKAGQDLGIGDIYIHLNLLPIGNGALKYAENPANITEAYTSYVKGYLEATGADRISCDVYLYRGSGICSWFYQTAQILRAQCDAYGADLTYCLQSFEMYAGFNTAYRSVGRNEMFGEFYSLAGMGIDDFAYYTYQVPATQDSAHPYPAESSFITLQGKKTNVYYYGQEVMETAQKMSDIVLNYEYQGGKFFIVEGTPNFDVSVYTTSSPDYDLNTSAVYDNSYTFTLLKDVAFDNDVVFATELYDGTNGLYMYMLQNAIDPINGQYGRTAETVTATFDSSYTYVAELHGGEIEYVKLKKGVYQKTLAAGDAVYLIPLK